MAPQTSGPLNVNVSPLPVGVCAGHSHGSVTVRRHVCSTPECTFQRQDSSWACWTFACYQELRVKWRELIFCLLEVHSLGLGRSLAHSLGCHAVGSLSHPSPPPPPPPPTPSYPHPPPAPIFVHSLSPSLSVSAWRLPLLQLTLVLPILGEMCAELLTPGLIFLLFPISSISSSWRLRERQRGGGRDGDKELRRRPEWKREEGGYCQLTSPYQTNNVWCREKIENTKLTVSSLVVGGSSLSLLNCCSHHNTSS